MHNQKTLYVNFSFLHPIARAKMSGVVPGVNGTIIVIIRPDCCARAASGHATTALPRSVMNSRRCMSDPKLKRQYLIGSNEHFDRG